MAIRTSIRTYTELSQLATFEERYRYLRIGGQVGEDTFGFDRYLNQEFYTSKEWRSVKSYVKARDLGYDLGFRHPDHEIGEGVTIIVHHMNPITIDDILSRSKFLLDPEYLISTIDSTHRAIHYGDENLLQQPLVTRRKNDTCPWRR